MDGKHCTLPHLAGKTFVYNAAEDRLELCVDAAGHFAVGPDVEDLAKEALLQLRSEGSPRGGGSREGSPSHGLLRLGSGGVVRRKEQTVAAFQGKGHSLGSVEDASPPQRPITRQHSSGVDLSASVSRDPPALSDISEDAGKELVRMAPGFVTMREGGPLEPGAMEQQRRKLQEMVSSIQASMERHLKEQQSLAATPAAGPGERTGGARAGGPGSDPEPSATMDVSGGGPQSGMPPDQPDGGTSGGSQDNQDAEPMDHS